MQLPVRWILLCSLLKQKNHTHFNYISDLLKVVLCWENQQLNFITSSCCCVWIFIQMVRKAVYLCALSFIPCPGCLDRISVFLWCATYNSAPFPWLFCCIPALQQNCRCYVHVINVWHCLSLIMKLNKNWSTCEPETQLRKIMALCLRFGALVF